MPPKHAPKKAHYMSHIQVYNVDNSTASPSALLVLDTKRYLFNAGEGIQRHFIEYKQKMQKITSVLVTRVSTDTLAGLPGMLLSQVAVGADGTGNDAIKSTVYGPEGLNQYVRAFRNYASSFQLEQREIGAKTKNPVIDDGFVAITALQIKPSSSSTAGLAAADTDGTAADGAGAAAEQPAAKRQRTDADSSGKPATHAAAAASGAWLGPGTSQKAPDVLCYVCQLASIPGKLDPKKAAELGVPRGPLLGELQRGNAVTAPNGRLIQPHEVMETPATPGACLLLVDCPSLTYLPGLVQQQQLQALQQEAAQQQHQEATAAAAADGSAAVQANGNGNSSSSGGIQVGPAKKFVVVHFSPAAVTGSEQYAAWVSDFGPAAQHLMASRDGQGSPTTLRAAVLQAQLNAIEPQVFSLQGFQWQQQQQHTAAATAGAAASAAAGAEEAGAGPDMEMQEVAVLQEVQRQKKQQPPNVLVAGNGCRFTLAPFRHQGLSLADVTAGADLDAVQAGVHDSKRSALLQLLEKYRAEKAQVLQQPVPPQLEGISRCSAELTLLGTCSACPSNHRNVSAYYLDLFERGGLLMDCGEDTMGQLERRFGRQQAAARILGLNAVWISHMHADHHGGLYPLLLRRQQLQQQQAAAAQCGGNHHQQPLLIMGPWPLFRVLSTYSEVLGLDFRFLTNTYFYAPSPNEPPAAALAAYKAACEAAGLAVLQPFPVQHVAHATGLRLESKDGWKVVFSGDTRPCQAVIDAARGATLLVHEATFEDELQDEAIAKKHSTTAEALGVAAAAGAYRTVLTHFSTRYPKIPVMKPPAAAGAGSTAGAGGSAEGGSVGTGSGSDLAAVGSVVVGFDLMSINLADLAWLPKTLPVLDELFKEEEASYQQDDEAVNT